MGLLYLILVFTTITACTKNITKEPYDKRSEYRASGRDVTQDQIEPQEIKKIIELQKMQRWDIANKEWNNLIKRNVQSSSIYLNLAITYNKLNDIDNAKKNFEKAIELKPNNYYAWQQLGVIERKLGNFKNSENSYIKALEIEPSDYISHINIGILYDLYLGDTKKAMQHFESAKESSKEAEKIVTPWLKELKRREKNGN